MDIGNTFSDIQYCTPSRKVFGDLSNGSPVSPTANLRLLTKVATSPVLFDTSDNQIRENNCKCLSRCKAPSNKSFECGYVRRTKSLSVLCERFLVLYPLNMENTEPKSISIKHMATDLGVEKRRVYDIVNIVESLDMAKKVAKDSYVWSGNRDVPSKIASLNEYAYKVGLDKLAMEFIMKSKVDEVLPLNLFNIDERRIGVLCLKFVMLLLVCRNKFPVTLDMAATVLIGGGEPSKTKSRRLYDISNMLVTLEIVSRLKPDVPGNPFKKPAFIYSGPCFDVVCNCEKCSKSTKHEQELLPTSVSCQAEVIDLTEEERLGESLSKNPGVTSRYDFTYEPVAKKRLTFNQDANIVFKHVTKTIIHKQFNLKTCKPLRNIVIQRPVAKLEPGSLYKAVKVGSSMQLVKIPS